MQTGQCHPSVSPGLPHVPSPAAPCPQEAFAGIEDDADEDLELGHSQMLAEKQREAQRGEWGVQGQPHHPSGALGQTATWTLL